ncbi:hypothetical protein FRC07_003186 [Ceratobasidium sp. 392]|nr:hypothetical protein FRC07_003186 [Ceratobasidium sp. 392]
MLPVEQLGDVVHCKYGDIFWEVQPEYVRAAHLEAVKIVYENPDLKGFPSEIAPK